MLYKFVKEKPPAHQIVQDLQKTFTKPMYGISVKDIHFSLLIHLSVNPFNEAKLILDPDMDEDAFSSITKFYINDVSEFYPKHIADVVVGYYPNTADLPIDIAYALGAIPDVHSKVLAGYDILNEELAIINNTAGNIRDTCRNYKEILIDLHYHFPDAQDRTIVEVPNKEFLEAYLLRLRLNGIRALPTFVYKPDVDTTTLEEAEVGESDTRWIRIPNDPIGINENVGNITSHKPLASAVEIPEELAKETVGWLPNTKQNAPDAYAYRVLLFDEYRNHLYIDIIRTADFNYYLSTIILRYVPMTEEEYDESQAI